MRTYHLTPEGIVIIVEALESVCIDVEDIVPTLWSIEGAYNHRKSLVHEISNHMTKSGMREVLNLKDEYFKAF